MKILVNALSGIGDALMFTPAIKKIKTDIPAAEIDALVMYKGVEDIYKNLPELSKTIYFDFPNRSYAESLNFVLRLRNRYDASINVYPSNRKEYNLISLLIGAKKRLAVKYLHGDFSNFGFLNSPRVEESFTLHNVEENIRMAELLTGRKADSIAPLQFILAKSDAEFADQFVKRNGIQEGDLVIGFHPGCSPLKNHTKRRWDPKNFAHLGVKLISQTGAKILLFGGKDEQYLKDEICTAINSAEAISVNTSSISETAAVMKRCSLFITNDSSLMHVAAAMKLNVLALIGPTNINFIHPWQTEYEIASLGLDCAPCFYYSPKPLSCSRKDLKFKCVKELSVDQVFEKGMMMIMKIRPSAT